MSNHKNALKTAWNDITGDTIKTGKGSLDKYASGWDAIFGEKTVAGGDFKNEETMKELEVGDVIHYPCGSWMTVTGKGKDVKWPFSESIQPPLPDSLEEYLKQEQDAQEHYRKVFGEEPPMELGHFVVDDGCVEPLVTDDSHVIPMTVVKALDFHDSSSNWIGKLLDGDSIEYSYDEHLGWVIK